MTRNATQPVARRPGDADDEHLARARALHARVGAIDLHVDSIIQDRLFGYDIRRAHRAGMRGQPLFWHADIPRLIEANFLGVCLGVHYFPWESEAGVRECHRQIDRIDEICAADERTFRVRSAADWDAAASAGKLALIPGLEGAHLLGGSLDALDKLLERGFAYMTLAHFSKNSAATPALGRGANETDKLTPFGVELVSRLNAHGVVVDVAHLNMPCAIQAAELSRAPVFATHSGAQGVHKHPRLLSDAAIDAVAASDGAIGIIFGPQFLTGRRDATSEAVADHIDYIVQRVGVRHVCTGSDYDGWLPAILADHRDCRDITRVTAALLRRGYTDDDIAAILRDNTLRVIRAAATAAA
ncbi:MAG: membrane dipeptidase [Myxococcales bacterium]|nr:membrane dipeptidase [Myxococcales bacterium]MCB9530693.1 membrane dipeptidase [Myxococcales bacterium]